MHFSLSLLGGVYKFRGGREATAHSTLEKLTLYASLKKDASDLEPMAICYIILI
jgi:hypothetical protein